MYLKFLTLVGASALSIALSAAGAQAGTILLNGGFDVGEASIPVGSFTDVSGGNSSTIADWTVTGNSVDWVGTYWQAANGKASIDLNGDAAGGVKQTLTNLVTGKEYAVTFDLAVNPDSKTPSTRKVLVQVGSGSGSYSSIFSDSVNIQTHSDMNYLPEELDFFASGTKEVLSFSSYKTLGAFGPVIDNVAVAAIPEVSTWVMLVTGFGMLGFAGYRRSKRSGYVSA